MALDEFEDLMAATVTIEPYGSQDGYAEETYGASVSYKAHIQGKVVATMSFTGAERVSNFQVYLNTAAAIDPRSRLTLPTGYSPQQPPIINVARHTDEQGQHHTKVYL